MDSKNGFERFSQAVNDGDTVQLKEIINYFRSIKEDLVAPIHRPACHLFCNFTHNKIDISVDFITRRLNKQGDSCLEVAVRKGHWAVLHKLLKQLKFVVYKQWKSPTHLPLLSVFRDDNRELIRDTCHKTPIVEFVGNFTRIQDDDPVWMEFILEIIVTSLITREEKIIALELMGAVFIMMGCRIVPPPRPRPYNLIDYGILKAIQCWKDAWILRDATEDGEPAIPQIPHVLPERLRMAFGGISEQLTLETLEQMEKRLLLLQTVDPFIAECNGLLQIQALLISHKVLSRSNHEQTFLILEYYEQLMRHVYWVRANNYQKIKGFRLYILLFIVETFYDNISKFTDSMKHLQKFLLPLSLIKSKLCYSSATDRIELRSASLLVAAKSTLKILANLHPLQNCHHTKDKLVDLWKMYDCLLKFLPMLNQEDHLKLIIFFSDYVEIFKLNCGLTTLLHARIASYKEDSWDNLCDVFPIVRFLLNAGVDPNETDRNGEAAIHILAKHSALEGARIILTFLLNAGAHIDQATPNGETVHSILNWGRHQFRPPSFYPFASHCVPGHPPNVVLRLSCYCAQSIRRNRIPYEDHLPRRLQEFVSAHYHV